MSYAINVEVRFFLISVLWGALILLAYDVLRILRRIIRHNASAVAVQDLVFWVTASVFIFAMIYRENDGIIRGFCIMGMSIGMVLYHYLLSSFLVTLITDIIKTLLKPLVIAAATLKKGGRALYRLLKQLLKILGKRLKNIFKSVRIALIRKRQRSVEKHQKKTQKKAAEKRKKDELLSAKKKTEAADKPGMNSRSRKKSSRRINAGQNPVQHQKVH